MPSNAISISPVVKIRGSVISTKWAEAISEIRVERQLQVPGRLTLRFSDKYYELSSSGDAVKLGDPASVTDTEGTPLITAEVVSIGIEQLAGRQPELVVVALDGSHRLARSSKISVFNQITYSDVVTKLVTDGSQLRPSVHATTDVLDYLMQADSNLGMITELARRLGFDWWVDAGGQTFHFEKPATSGPVAVLDASADLSSFTVRAANLRPSSVTVEGWDRENLQTLQGSASSASTAVAKSDLANQVASASVGDIVSSGLGAASRSEADTLAQAIYNRASSAAVTAKGVVPGGAPAVDIGTVVKVTNAGPVSGDYPVTAVEHVYRNPSGFTTRFVSGDRHPSSMVDVLGGGGGSVAYSGTAHVRSGVAIGVVTNIKDPKNMGRVKVRLSGIDASSETDWARVVAIGGGASHGGVWIPEVNDEVLIAFEGGSSRQPVVLGGLYGKNTMPDTAIKEGKLQSRTFTSGLGHVVGLYDGDQPADQAIRMVLAGAEHSIMLSKEKLTATVPSGTPVEIVAGETSMKMSASGDVTLQGVNVTIKATAEMKLQAPNISVAADAQLQMTGQAQAKLGGAMVDVEAEGVAKLAGAMVQIN